LRSAAWQQAIRDAGFPVELDTDFAPDTFSGFLPYMLQETEAGFEYLAQRLSPAEAEEVGAPAGTDFSVVLNTHSSLEDVACSAMAAGALASASGGVLVDPQSGEAFGPADALGWAAAQAAEIGRALKWKPG
jgi:hypothetical protein